MVDNRSSGSEHRVTAEDDDQVGLLCIHTYNT